MSGFIYVAVLFFGFAFGESKFRCNKLPGSRFAAFKNDVFEKAFTRNGFDVSGKSAFESDIEITNVKNSRRELMEGKSEMTNQIIIPLLMGANMAGVFLLSLIAVKFFLWKGIFAGKMAFIILGLILGRKIAISMLFKNHNFYSENGFGQYPINEPDLSGYGYEYKHVAGLKTSEEKYSSLIGKE